MNKAFTLIELLVVVAIIGILAAVGVVAYNGYTSSAKISVVKTNHKTVKNYITVTKLLPSLKYLNILFWHRYCLCDYII